MRRRDVLSGLAASAAATVWPRPDQLAGTRPGLASLLDAEATAAAAVGVPALTKLLHHARRAFAASHYEELTGRLSTLIAAAAGTRRDGAALEREQAMIVLAAGYRLASELCVKRNDDALAWVLADRALTVARESGRPAPIGHASRSVAIAMRRAGHHDDAVALLSASANHVRPGPRPTGADVAIYGSLLCTAAYASAQAGHRADAEAFMAEASQAAERTTAPVSAGETTFSQASVAVYQIGVFTVFGDSATALRHASGVQVQQLETPERYARYCIDTARAWEQHGRHDRATQALCAAEAVAPEELRRPASHELITRMLYAPALTPSGLRNLAARVGAVG